jgi:HD-GYP domain-containing protein (c-di-GMP phosphodiesterase class II)
MPVNIDSSLAGREELRLSEVIASLSYALDLTEGQGPGHSARSCLIGMRLGQALGLPTEQLSALFYALLLKDAGCSTNASQLCALFATDDRQIKREHKLIDWTRKGPSAAFALQHAAPDRGLLGRAAKVAAIAVKSEQIGVEMMTTRCERGADIVRLLGFPEETAQAIRHLDEHWDGRGQPAGVVGTAIPLLGRILCLAQTTEVFSSRFGMDAAFETASARRGTWFDPDLVDLLLTTTEDQAFWTSVMTHDPIRQLGSLEPEDRVLLADDEAVDRNALAFARVIDAKSPYTYQHSERVAVLAVGIGEVLAMSSAELRELRQAALLHDIGKLGVSNAILDKPGKLTDEEWAEMRRHPGHTYDILSRVGRFRRLAELAASHHERLDGKGYHRGLVGAQLEPMARILVVADIAEALSADRPYRRALGWDQTLMQLRSLVGPATCGVCHRGLERFLEQTSFDPFRRDPLLRTMPEAAPHAVQAN